ncbi:hypothetical protein PR202_gb12031 [Eleusine coracana subsp. coracana]|uniref:Secreted protein n=1 Tax=Eleusine coracana subsp. coracana TaxID=191504 RepID=A0AAV5EPC1_ELECO|nr:hypothetical protein PR202_gb12031 [Eleusine coracana subsp. coracana]
MGILFSSAAAARLPGMARSMAPGAKGSMAPAAKGSKPWWWCLPNFKPPSASPTDARLQRAAASLDRFRASPDRADASASSGACFPS